MQLKAPLAVILPALCLVLSSCTSSPPSTSTQKTVTVLLESRSQSKVSGEIQITELDSKTVQLKGTIKGLNPSSLHGFHIHEFGDCSSANAASAGGHFNPDKKNHGPYLPERIDSHAGDLGNIQSDAAGFASIDMTLQLSLSNSPASISGKSIIIHAKQDDFKTQPSGNSGDRIACAAIPALADSSHSKPKIDTPPPPFAAPTALPTPPKAAPLHPSKTKSQKPVKTAPIKPKTPKKP